MITKLNYDDNGLIPVVVQNAQTQQVLMLGYMNETSFQQTITTKIVTFYSRSRQEIWVKGATSGNYLNLVSWSADCDNDALLITAIPTGPTCHTGEVSCFGEQSLSGLMVISQLEQTIQERFTNPKEGSYIQSLIEKGLPKIAQKVGEEGVEVVIEAMRNEPQLFLEESADLLFHYLILLRAKGVELGEVLEILKGRMG
ncbi:MAG: bifunctional phosphoribosyl-AMP cyclohydrolase/phosphoribosyl-ATP diphosphatase [Candidatus Fluviicola riflensis]|nr:MAG: bifunctional phosphoribosyl-AMP cyclohydrolase/phosphoribosyl-ATP diphosphatase [Candidatus Fluviicola riflensis]OGS79666.1 MAG: bifunctional phosphoribosyl-AMP cyclohydrolase/phosphoribosyl-ATP diphosphatase [Candidatus Fluviicola riflensis]OGS87098.1 MAG: bifunctional phosphoribosyl-AMP cyclohydrolase/phosphoribosyl-ATP diphosphatase [Fluviicola sp. RIFCSPHIGHO2_01_FULL_43_53]OGS89888.1 MAG: bifunctional phosphoribosyl-AMP cyclohydrolase/phosphoribosyl-ATP diphosphatase [Fluviicola sp.